MEYFKCSKCYRGIRIERIRNEVPNIVTGCLESRKERSCGIGSKHILFFIYVINIIEVMDALVIADEVRMGKVLGV